MTLGALTVLGGGLAFTVMTGGAGAALLSAGAPLAVQVNGAAAAAAGVASGATVTATTTAVGAAAGGVASGTTGFISGALLSGGTIASSAFQAGIQGAAVFGPHGALIACFQADTSVELTNGSNICVAELKEGEMVKCKDGYCKVTNVTILEGTFQAHKLHFDNGETLTATSPHYLIKYFEDQEFVVPTSMVKIGDQMLSRKGELLTVVAIDDIQLPKKVNVEVEGGRLFANGIHATGVCEFGPQKEYDMASFLAEYHEKHSKNTKVAVNSNNDFTPIAASA